MRSRSRFDEVIGQLRSSNNSKLTPEKKPYIFAAVMPELPPQAAGGPGGPGGPPMEMLYHEFACPLCKAQVQKVASQYKALFDPLNIERYLTPEAEQMIAKIREEYKKKRK